MLKEYILPLLVLLIIYYMDQSPEGTYTKLAAGAAAVFFPLGMYRNYQNKKVKKAVFKQTEVSLWPKLYSNLSNSSKIKNSMPSRKVA